MRDGSDSSGGAVAEQRCRKGVADAAMVANKQERRIVRSAVGVGGGMGCGGGEFAGHSGGDKSSRRGTSMNFCHDILQKRGGQTRRAARMSTVSTIGGGGGRGGPAAEGDLLSVQHPRCELRADAGHVR